MCASFSTLRPPHLLVPCYFLLWIIFSSMALCPELWVPSLKSSQKMIIKKYKNRISTASWVEFEDSSHTVPPVKGYVVNWLKPWCSDPALVYLNIFLPIYFHLPNLRVLIPCINCYFFFPPMWLTSTSSFLWLVMFRGRGGVSWGGAGVCRLLGRVVILTPFLWDFFFSLYCLTDIHEIWNDIFNKEQNWKKKACKFWPHCFMGKT